MLLPFAEYDLGKFIEMHMADKDNNMGRFCLKEYTQEQALIYVTNMIKSGEVFIWTVYSISDDPQLVGFIYLTDVSNYMVSIHGIMDKMFAKSMKKTNGNFAYDAAKSLIDYCFSKGVNRIETDVCQSNRKALALDKKLGFIKEGILRKVVIKNDGFDNLVILSILKEEYDGGKVKTANL